MWLSEPIFPLGWSSVWFNKWLAICSPPSHYLNDCSNIANNTFRTNKIQKCVVLYKTPIWKFGNICKLAAINTGLFAFRYHANLNKTHTLMWIFYIYIYHYWRMAILLIIQELYFWSGRNVWLSQLDKVQSIESPRLTTLRHPCHIVSSSSQSKILSRSKKIIGKTDVCGLKPYLFLFTICEFVIIYKKIIRPMNCE